MNKHINSEAVSSIDSITWCAEWTARLLDAQPTSWPSGTCRVAFSVPFGNPLNDGTWTYTWEKGRRLKCMSESGTTASFKYNEVNGVVTNYTLHGKNIMHMTQGSNSLHFYYDAQNRPAIVEFNGTKYGYILNLQGDVLGLVDSNGTEVVKYVYDAWDNFLSTTGSLASTLGIIQPFRYRGYVYDEETKLYYLRSRYYNPNWQRFINADCVLSGNLFSYCQNKPLMAVDPSGYYLEINSPEVFAWLYELTGGMVQSINTELQMIPGWENSASFPISCRLVSELIESPHIISIHMDFELYTKAVTRPDSYGAFYDFDLQIAGTGASSEILINPIRENITPNYIVLSHELIHAWQNMNGMNAIHEGKRKAFSEFPDVPYGIYEHYVTGCCHPSFAISGFWPTENNIRKEHSYEKLWSCMQE